MPSQSPKAVIQLEQNNAWAQLHQLHCTVSTKTLRPVFGYLNKTFRSTIEGLFIHEPSMVKLKELLDKGERVVLMPYYKSFTDLFVILYALYVNEIEIPFTFGNFEDTPRVRFIDSIVRGCGFVFTKRSREQSLQ